MNVLYGPSIRIAHLNGLHDFLTARGWELTEYALDSIEDGYPTDPEATWRYPHSYGGTQINKIDEVSPYPLSCWFTFANGLHIVISSAGNIRGCPEHADTEHEFEVDDPGHEVEAVDDQHDLEQLGLDRIAALLDELEPQARELNPRDLIECRFFGPCGEA